MITDSQVDELRADIRLLTRKLDGIEKSLEIAIRQGRENAELIAARFPDVDAWLRSKRETEPPDPPTVPHAAPAPGKPRVLVVDDSPSHRRAVEALLTRSGYDVSLAASGDQAIGLIQKLGCFDLAIVDQRLGAEEAPGIVVCDTLRAVCPDQQLLLISGADSVELEGRQLAFLPKPWRENSVLLDKIEQLLGRKP